eukprot:1061527-Rhodomonas_salina.1
MTEEPHATRPRRECQNRPVKTTVSKEQLQENANLAALEFLLLEGTPHHCSMDQCADKHGAT